MSDRIGVQSNILDDNSTTTPLDAGGIFTGAGEYVNEYSSAVVSIYTDAPGLLSVQFSPDGTNWDHKYNFSVSAGSCLNSVPISGKYIRTVYTCGATGQTAFRLSVRVHAYQPYEAQSRGVSVSDGGNLDAFGRIRVSDPVTLFDSKQIFDNQPLFWDEELELGAGITSAWSQDTASTTITSTASTAGSFVRQTFMRFNYQPGKSQLVLMTFNLHGSAGTEAEKWVGIGDENNGLFLLDDAGTLKFVRRSFVTGSAVDTEVPQSEWNLDALDGNGPSGITLDKTKTQILVIDYEWLGVGRVRMGFNINGQTYYCHQFLNANNLTKVYMSTPNLPLRYQLVTTANTNTVEVMECICASVQSEGGQQDLGILRHVDSGQVPSLGNTLAYAMIGIRLKAANVGANIKIEGVSAIALTPNDTAHWELILNPTVAGTFTYSDQTNSSVQIAKGVATNTVTGGTIIDGGFFSTNLPPVVSIPNALRLGEAIDGTMDTIVLVIKPITNNITVDTSMTWRELS